MSKMERKCRELLIEAKKEGMSISALHAILEEQWLKSKSDGMTDSYLSKDSNTMIDENSLLSTKLIETIETLSERLRRIKEKSGRKIEEIKKEAADKCYSTSLEEERIKISRDALEKIREVEEYVRKAEGEMIKIVFNFKS